MMLEQYGEHGGGIGILPCDNYEIINKEGE